MPKLASYDPAAPLPAPINGWWDTDGITYPSLPAAAYTMTDEQWDARLDGTWAFDGTTLVPLPPPPPTADQVLAGKIAQGIAITSTSTPALACTMALDDVTMAQIGAVARDAASGLGLPMGAPSFTYPDIDRTPRTFSEAQVIALYKAQRDLLFQLNTQASILRQGGTPDWPAQSAIIP